MIRIARVLLIASLALWVGGLSTISFVLAPTVGFCCGCAVYVGLRDVLVKLGAAKRYANGACDINIDGSEARRHQ